MLAVISGHRLLAQAGSNKLVAIAFYNAENLFDPADDPLKEDDEFTPGGAYKYTQEIYKQKLHNISVAISRIGKDKVPSGAALIGLAEIENGKVLTDLVNQPLLKGKAYRYVWYNSPDPRGIDVALLYDPKVFKVLSSRPVAVKLEGAVTRDILYVNGILAGDTIHILVNHWPSRRDGKQETEWERKIAAQTARSIIDSIYRRRAAARVILMGDLNDDPSDASVSAVLRANGDSRALKKDELYNPWLAIHHTGTGTLQYKKKWNLFDQILCSPALLSSQKGLHYNGAQVFNNDFLQQRWGRFKGSPYRSYRGTYWMNGYSDHYPVVMFLNKL